MKSIAYYIGVIFATYFIVWPVIYFGWNFMMDVTNTPQYYIPGFWLGMGFYFLFNIAKNSIFGRNK